jgi:transcriptional regulator with XRE-family HTH domain
MGMKTMQGFVKSPDVVYFSSKMLRNIMLEKGITLAQLACILDIPAGSLGKFLNRERINYYTLDKIACYFGRHPIEFII